MAETITVSQDGDWDYTKISHAVENSTSGDTILVKSGEYREYVVINHTLRIMGDSSNTTVVPGRAHIDEGRSGFWNCIGFEVNANNVTISNFTFASSATFIDIEWGILIKENTSFSNIQGCLFESLGRPMEISGDNGSYEDCGMMNGGAIIVRGTSNSFWNCEITNSSTNGISFYGDHNSMGDSHIRNCNDAGISIKCDVMHLENSAIEACGSGITAESRACMISILNCSFDTNACGVSAQGGWVIRHSLFENNSVGIESASDISIQDSTFSNNARGMALARGIIVVSNCIIEYDTKENLSIKNGIGIRIGYGNEVVNCQITGYYYGVSIVATQRNLIKNCNLSNNVIGIYMDEGYRNTIQNCEFMNNEEYGIYIDVCGSNNNYLKNNTYSNNGKGGLKVIEGQGDRFLDSLFVIPISMTCGIAISRIRQYGFNTVNVHGQEY